VSSTATSCPWCKAEVRGKVEAAPTAAEQLEPPTAAEQLEPELAALRAWSGNPDPPPPLLSTGLCVALAAMAVGALFAGGYIVRESRTVREAFPLALFPAGALAILAVFLLREPLRVRNVRDLASPRDALTYFMELVRTRRYAAASFALAGHAQALERHAKFGTRWDQANPSSAATLGTIDAFSIGAPEPLGEDACLVPLSVTFGSHGGVSIPLVGGVRTHEWRQKDFLKLLVKRRDRWFLVNGLPADRLDRGLSALLAPAKA
jgi:hypothetical protein